MGRLSIPIHTLSAVYLLLISLFCPRGGIGRRSRFRIYRLTVCRFESGWGYLSTHKKESFMIYQVHISLKSFDTLYIEKSESKILQINNYLRNLSNKGISVFLPIIKKKYTVLRSPHIDKKSREQFEWKRYKKSITLFFQKRGAVSVFLFLLRNGSFPGVQVEMCYKHSTFF